MPAYGCFLFEGAPRHAEIEFAPEGEIAHFIADLFENPTRTGQSVPVADLAILPPVAPRKLFAIGLNYADHAAEHGNEVPAEPLMWFKATSALLAHGGTVEIAYPDHRTDYEAELALVIGVGGKRIAEKDALHHVLGVAPSQDISDRVVQRSESQWARAKSFDTYAPLGPYLYTGLELDALRVQTLVNGAVKQDGNTRDLIFSPAKLVSFLSQRITLEAGDVILTGTPAGVGPLRAGDAVETRIGAMKPLLCRVRDTE